MLHTGAHCYALQRNVEGRLFEEPYDLRFGNRSEHEFIQIVFGDRSQGV